MSSRVLIISSFVALIAVATFAYLTGSKAGERRAAQALKTAAPEAPAPAEKPAEAAPQTQAAAVAPESTTTTTAVVSSAQAVPVAARSTTPKTLDVSAYYGKKFRIGAPNLKKVALSFDDGPYASTTPQVLQILRSEGIRATFFMLGESVRKYPDVARAVAAAGHEIACHTDKHVDLKRKSAEVIRHEVAETAKYIEQMTGQKPHLFRPPFGTYNSTVLKTCADAGLVMVTWSVDPDDWRKNSTADTIYETCLKQTTNGAVILMHDTKEKTIGALQKLITELRTRGYEFVTVGELITETAAQPPELLAQVAGVEAVATPAPPAAIPLSKSGM